MSDVSSAEQGSHPSALNALRLATGEAHGRLESRMPFAQAGFDRAVYQRLMQAYYGFYVELEHRLWLTAEGDTLLEGRRKAPVIQRDLQALGFEPASIGALAQPVRVPWVTSRAQWLGAMYVLEGATLGGQVLKRMMHQRLGIDAGNGGAFLDVYGADTARLWKRFLVELATLVEPDEIHAAARAALETFLCFESWLEENDLLSEALAA